MNARGGTGVLGVKEVWAELGMGIVELEGSLSAPLMSISEYGGDG